MDITGNAHNFAGIQKNWDPTILLIVKQTLSLRVLLKEIDAHAHDSEVKHCSRCAKEQPEKRCVQHIDVTLNLDPMFIEQWKGVGVSKVPKQEQMKPRKVSALSQIFIFVF